MDLLQECAAGFERLLPYQYHIVAGRKGRTLEFTISFDRADFHHLAGLHKLTDNIRFLTGRRANIMQEILSGKLTFAQTQQSVFFQQMEPRLKPLVHLEEFLAKRTGNDTQVCRTFFPKAEKDYAQGQPRYTLLKKEKINIVTGEVTVQYDRLTPKTTKS